MDYFEILKVVKKINKEIFFAIKEEYCIDRRLYLVVETNAIHYMSVCFLGAEIWSEELDQEGVTSEKLYKYLNEKVKENIEVLQAITLLGKHMNKESKSEKKKDSLTESDLTPVWKIECNFCGVEEESSEFLSAKEAIKDFESNGWQIKSFESVGETGVWCGECDPDEKTDEEENVQKES